MAAHPGSERAARLNAFVEAGSASKARSAFFILALDIIIKH